MCLIKPTSLHAMRSMQQRINLQFKFDREAFLSAVLIFVIEVLIATVWSHHRLLRGFGGDALAVVWVYFVFRTFITAPVWFLTVFAFLTGCLIELGQYVASVNHWHISNTMLRIVLGSVADWHDVLAYAVGALAVLLGGVLLARLRPCDSA